MPRGTKKLSATKPSFLKVAFLLLQYGLIKIGEAPVRLVKLIIIHHRHAGRPRKSWFLPRLVTSWRLKFRKLVPKKARFAILTAIVLILLYQYTYLIFTAASQLPNPNKLTESDTPLTTEFYDRNGKLLYRLYEGRNRTLVKLNELPGFVAKATIAAEDKNFYSHPGVDFMAMIRAFISNTINHPKTEQLEGASTITQQLIKNTLLTPEKTYVRKIKEIILALWAERIYSKNQILQMYLNEAPYGGPAWGIEAAAETYFGLSAKNLSLAQAAYLAGLPASPTQFSPYSTNPRPGIEREKQVLRRMVEDKFITESQATRALHTDLRLKPQVIDIKAPHFVMYVKDLLSQKYGPRVVSQGGLKIYTTLDLGIEEMAEKAVANQLQNLTSLNVQNGAAMVVDAKTGQILAMVGSRDYYEPNFGSYNVTTAARQPGSSIKIVTYAAAFKQGFSPGNTIIDAPVSFKDGVNTYSPGNYDGHFHGPVSLRTAFGSSYNIPAVKLLATVGIPNWLQTAKDMGITTFDQPQNYGLSLTLGGADVTMVDMMSAYDSLSQLGDRQTVTPILKVTDSNGNILENYQNKGTQVLTPQVAYLVTSVLADNQARTPAFGPDSSLVIPGHTVAVKTGTTDNKRDNWTFGYTPDVVVGVWVGNNDNSPMNPALTSGITGAAPIWHDIMTNLLQDRPDVAFARPSGIADTVVDGRRDLTISNQTPKSLVSIRRDQNQITLFDGFSSYATSSATAAKNEAAN